MWPAASGTLSRCALTARTFSGLWLGQVLSFLYPEVCVVCDRRRAGPAEGYVCAECLAHPGHLRRIEPPYCDRCGLPYAGETLVPFVCGNCSDLALAFDSARAAVVATPFILDLVHRYKYRQAVWLEPFFAGLLVSAAAPALAATAWDVIVPVPLHPVRERERGFNQAERLARRLSRATGIPLWSRAVRRVHSTETQALLDRRRRVHNVARAFAVTGRASFAGSRVVVVDDVLTTGATTSAVSRALRQAGAAAVVVWTVARGD